MLTTKLSISLRFLFNWIILTLLFSCLFWLRDQIIYTKKIGINWQYNRPLWEETFTSIAILFFFICGVYYLIIYSNLVKITKIWLKILLIFMGIYVVIIVLASNSIGFSYKNILNFQATFFVLLFTISLIGIDKLIFKILRNIFKR